MNAVPSFASHGSRRRRSTDRFEREARATVRTSDQPIDAVVRNISVGGCRFDTATAIPLGATVSVALSGVGTVPAVIAYREGDAYGCTFLRPVPQSAIDAVGVVDTVVYLCADGETPTFDEPDVVRFPGAVRALTIIGGAAACWAAIGFVILA